MSETLPQMAGHTTAWAIYFFGLVAVIAAQLWLLRATKWWFNASVGFALLIIFGFPVESYPGEPALAPALMVALFEGLLGGGSAVRAGAPLATAAVIAQLLFSVFLVVVALVRKLLARRQ